MAKRLYTEEEAREILNRAVALDQERGGFTHDELEELAVELDISAEALEEAERLWNAEREAERPEPAPVATTTRDARRERRRQRHQGGGFSFGKFVLILLFFSLIGGGGLSWFLGILVPLVIVGAFLSMACGGARVCGTHMKRHDHTTHH